MNFQNYSIELGRQICTEVVHCSLKIAQQNRISQCFKQRIRPISIKFVENQSNEILKTLNLEHERNSDMKEIEEPWKIKKKNYNEKIQVKKLKKSSNISINLKNRKKSIQRKNSFLMLKLNKFQNKLVPLEKEKKQIQNRELQDQIQNLRKKKNRIEQMMINLNKQFKDKELKDKQNYKSLQVPQFTTGINGNLMYFEKKKAKIYNNCRDKKKIKPFFSIIDVPKDKQDMINQGVQVFPPNKEKDKKRKSSRDFQQQSQMNIAFQTLDDFTIKKLMKKNHKKTNSSIIKKYGERRIKHSKKYSQSNFSNLRFTLK